MGVKRIIDLETLGSISEGDYIPVDNETWGTKKYPANALGGNGITDDLREALLQLAAHVAYIDDDGQDYYDDLEDALMANKWKVTNTLSNCTSSNSAKYSDKGTSYSATISAQTGYTLVGATVSVTMGGTDITSTAYNSGLISIASVTGNVVITVTAVAKAVSSISAVYTQSGTVYTTDSLDSLKSDLVVTATYNDTSTATVPSADYTLSGTLTAGTSTVTVTYEGKTTTFTVTVTQASPYTFYDYVKMTYNAGETVPANYGIVTDIPMSSDWLMELSFKYPASTATAAQNILGIRYGQSGTKEFGLFITPSSGKLGYWYGNTDTTQNITALVADQLNTVVVQPVGVSSSFPTYATIKLNGTDYSTGSTATGQTWDSWLSMFQYGTGANTTSNRTDQKSLGLELGEIVIKNTSNTVLYDLKPAQYQSYYGFYDSVNDKFYYNATYYDKYTCGNWS